PVVLLPAATDSGVVFQSDFNTPRLARTYPIPIAANIKLVDHRAEDNVLWKKDQYRFTENSQTNTESTDAFDQETRAIREIAVRFAETLVTNLLEGFCRVTAPSPSPSPRPVCRAADST